MSNVTEQTKHKAYVAYCERMKGVCLQGFNNARHRHYMAGFNDGVTAALDSLWRDSKIELPEDGDYLTMIEILEKNEKRLVVEIAPWRDGKYQGSYTLAMYLERATVKAWLRIPPLKRDENG